MLRRLPSVAVLLIAASIVSVAAAHGLADDDRSFLEDVAGIELIPYIYLGAKHMVTGYDHLLFLLGVIFFLYGVKQIVAYVTLFALGHSVTLLWGVLTGTQFDPHLIDAIIGVSVVYKALDNLGAFKRWLGFQPDTRVAVLVFGFFHGLGLATKLQEFTLSRDALVPNILAFNIGVEIGQLLALSAIVIAMNFWRRTTGFSRQAFAANVAIMAAGFVLIGYQLVGFATSSGA